MLDSVAKQKKELTYFSNVLDTLAEQIECLDPFNPMNPYSSVLAEEVTYLEATISGMNFWQNTSTIIIAIKHKEELLVSPGSYARTSLNDALYSVGYDESTLQRVQNFFCP